MNNGFYSNRYNGKGVQARRRRAQSEALKKAIAEGKIPKADPVKYSLKEMFRGATNFFLRRSQARSRGKKG